jgi:hypothetical protein
VVERREGELVRVAQARPSAARWRRASDDAPARDGEVLLAGRRVLLGGGRIVAPWRETLRYTPLQAGYHGGASAAEIAVPLVVLVHATQRDALDGWDAAPPQTPPWWLGLPAAAAPEAPLPSGPVRWTEAEVAPSPETAAPAPPMDAASAQAATAQAASADLARAVVTSPVFAAQRRRARRVPLDPGLAETVLRELLSAGGQLSQTALAATAGIPEFRMPGMMASLRRLLNVEGYQVLRYDADAGRVILDEALLLQQFDLESYPEGRGQ